MTTGFEKETRYTATDKARVKGWIWAIVAAAIVIALALWAFSGARHNNRNAAQAPSATSGSVQSSGTGEQGAVGNFREKVVPNGQASQQSGPSSGAYDALPGANPQAPAGSATQGAASDKNTPGAGAGNTGINTSTDTEGGAPVPTKSQQSGR